MLNLVARERLSPHVKRTAPTESRAKNLKEADQTRRLCAIAVSFAGRRDRFMLWEIGCVVEISRQCFRQTHSLEPFQSGEFCSGYG
jgi:hypothetical protein